MRAGSFKISIKDSTDWCEVDGWSNGVFGVHERNGYYYVTHLLTGLKLDMLTRRRQEDSCALADLATKWVWTSPTAEAVARDNGYDDPKAFVDMLRGVRLPRRAS